MANYLPQVGRNFDLSSDMELASESRNNIPFKDVVHSFANNAKVIPIGWAKENYTALLVSKAISDKSTLDVEPNYNPFSDTQLLPYLDYMDGFITSQSRAETSDRLKNLIHEHKENYNNPLYWVGRILGGLTDPVSLALFSPMGKFILSGRKLSQSAKLGSLITAEELGKQAIDPLRTTKEGMIISGVSFVLPVIFPSAVKNPQMTKAFKKFDKEANFLDEVDDIKANGFYGNSVGAAQIRKTFSEEQWIKLNEIAATGVGWEKLPLNPIFRILNSKDLESQDIIEKLLDISVLQNKNWLNMPTAPGGSIESNLIRERTNVFMSETGMEDFYKEYLKRHGEKLPLFGLRVGIDVYKGTNQVVDLKTFKHYIWKSLIGIEDDTTAIPEIIKAKELMRKKVFNRYGNQYAELGITESHSEYLLGVYKAIVKRGYRRATQAEMNPKGKGIEDLDDDYFTGNPFRTLTKKERIWYENSISKLEERIEYLKKHGPLAKNYAPRIWQREQINARWEYFKTNITIRIKNSPKNKHLSPDEIDNIVESMKSAQPYIRFDEMFNESPAQMSISRNFRSREINLEPQDELWLANEGFIETDVFVLQRLYFNAVAPDILITKVFGDPMASGFKWTNYGADVGSVGGPGLLNIWGKFEKRLKSIYDPSNPKSDWKKLSKSKKEKYNKIEEERRVMMRDLEGARDLIRGSYGLPDDPQRAFSQGVRMFKQYNAMTMLTGTLAATADVARNLSTSGILRGFRTSYDLFSNALGTEVAKLSLRQAYLSGEALDLVLGSRAMSMYDLENSFGVFSKLEKGTSKLSNIYFTYVNQMNGWNTLMKGWSSAVNGTRIIEESRNLVLGKISKVNKAKLLNSGIDEESAYVIWQQYQKHGLGKWANKADWKEIKIARTEMWDKEAQKAADTFHNALGKDIRTTIVTPDKGEVPLWFNTEMGGVIVQFKKFAMSATNKMMMRGLQERDMNFLGGVLLLMIAGSVVDATRTRAFDRSYSKKPLGDKLTSAFERSGLGGILSDINNVIERVSNNKVGLRPMMGAGRPYSSYSLKNAMSGFGILGPTSSQIGTITDMMLDWGKGTHNHYTARNVRRLIPFQNIWYLDGLFDQVEKGLRF